MRKYICTVFLISLMIPFGVAAQKKKPASVGCGASSPLKVADLTESGLRNWLEQAQGTVSKVEDFVCCLPKEIRDRYLVTHSSFAAQNAVPYSPRVIFYQKRSEKQPFTALTINGGSHPAVSQEHSVEIAIENPKTQELEYFDLEFFENEKPHLSERNTALCLSCHGVDGVLPVGGLRPIFDPVGQANRFVGGKSPFCSSIEQKYYRAVEAATVDAMKRNQRFSCMDQMRIDQILNPNQKSEKTSPEMYSRLEEFHQNLSAINQNRVARTVRAEPVFTSLREGFFGLMLCGGKLDEWLSDDVIKKVRSQIFLKASYRSADWQEAFKLDLDRREKELKKFQMQMSKALKDRDFSLDTGIDPVTPSELRCEGQKSQIIQETLDVKNMSFPTSFLVQWTPEDTEWVRRLRADWVARAIKGDMVLAGILAALNVDTSPWQMSALKEGVLSDPMPLPEIFEQEWSQNTKWRNQMLAYFKVAKSPQNSTVFLKLKNPDRYLTPKEKNSCSAFLEHVKKSYKKPL